MSLRIVHPAPDATVPVQAYALAPAGRIAPAGCACQTSPAAGSVRPAGQLGGSFSVSIPGWAVAGALVLGGYYLYTRR
jgi:hypothetical protein